MGGITNPVHLAFIAVIALLVLGPKRLPDLARSLGSGMREFRESLNSATSADEPGLPAAGETTLHAQASASAPAPASAEAAAASPPVAPPPAPPPAAGEAPPQAPPAA